MKKSIVALTMLVGVAQLGCATKEKLGEFGDMELYSFYSRVSGAPALTGVVTVDKPSQKGQICTVFSQNDLASIGLEGIAGMGQAALNGMTAGMFRRRDKHEQNISVGGGGASSGGGGGGAGGGTINITGASADSPSTSTATATSGP